MEKKDKITKIISDNIRAERARKGLSQEKTANQLKMSALTYKRWEHLLFIFYLISKVNIGYKIPNKYLLSLCK